jgi:hypothetical protein
MQPVPVSMKITSEQKFDTVQVTDIDIAFPGDLQTYTLREGKEGYINGPMELILDLGTGTVTFNKAHMHWLAIRNRTIRVPAPADQAGKSAVPPVA